MSGSGGQRTHDFHSVDEAESRLCTLAQGRQVPGPDTTHEASGVEITTLRHVPILFLLSRDSQPQ